MGYVDDTMDARAPEHPLYATIQTHLMVYALKDARAMSARPLILISQRVDPYPDRGERRDALDQAWAELIWSIGAVALPAPNHAATAAALAAQLNPAGVILSGGGDIGPLGGDAPERDAAEEALLAWAAAQRRPALGVCRGAQALLHRDGATLDRVDGHIATRHPLAGPQGDGRMVNSFHGWSVTALGPLWRATATAPDGGIEAAVHVALPWRAWMWHPERETPADSADLAALAQMFGPT